MTGCASDRHHVVLVDRDRRRGHVVGDAVAVELTEHLLAADASPDGNAEFLRRVTRSSASLAAWLMDRFTQGARERLASRDAMPGVGTALGFLPWDALSTGLTRVQLIERLSESLELCVVSAPDLVAWRRAEHRARLIAERAAELAGAAGWQGVDDTRWWALYLTSPVGIVDEKVSRWSLEPAALPEPPTAGPSQIPWLDWIIRAAASIDALPDLPPSPESFEVPESSGHDSTCHCAIQSPSWPTLLPNVLRLALRRAQLEDEFQQTLEREKLLAMKELAYGASHEINNPLANISSRDQLLLREESDPERRRSLATINSQAFRAHEMIADMMLFAKPPALQLQETELNGFFTEVINQLAASLPHEVTLESAMASGPWACQCDPAPLAEAIRAIWTNALEAMGHVGRLRVVARTVTAADGSPWAELELADSGPGIRPEVRRHLFDPFYSGREAGRGLGFGLSKAWRIVNLHGGRLDAASEPGEGAVMTIGLPLI